MQDDESVSEAAAAASAAAGSPAAASSAAASGSGNKKKKKKKGAAASKAPTAEEMEAERWLDSLTEEDILNPALLQADKLAEFAAQFRAAQPYPHLALQDLLDASFARTLENELRGLAYYTKSSDLFEFAQSSDLKSVDSPLVRKLKSVLYGPRFRSILQTITGIELPQGLGEDVSMSANVYGDTNTLLCHDDELQGRRIAYILYFVPKDWDAKTDGGALDLFATDPATGQPGAVVKSLSPAWNSFAFFEVSPASFHQVAEVTVGDKTDPATGENRVRLSVSGWFHGAPIKRPEHVAPPALAVTPLAADTSFTLEQFLSPEYLKERNIAAVARQFQEESSIELASFLAKDVYARFQAALEELPEQEWKQQGPVNKQRFDAFENVQRVTAAAAGGAAAAAAAAAAPSSSAAFLSSLSSFLQSSVFGAYLARLTGLEYLSSHAQLRRFKAGSYTLAHSDSEERFEEAVDVTLVALRAPKVAKVAAPVGIGKKKKAASASGSSGASGAWDAARLGGSTHYIEEGEQDELMALNPTANTLSIVYRAGIPAGPQREQARAEGKGGVIRFVKYVNHRAEKEGHGPRYDIDAVFRIAQTEDDEGEDEEDEDDMEEEEEEEEEEQPPPKKGGGKQKGKK